MSTLNDKYSDFLPPAEVATATLLTSWTCADAALVSSNHLQQLHKGHLTMQPSHRSKLACMSLEILLPCHCSMFWASLFAAHGRPATHCLLVQFRRALRRPRPAEREYLAAQYTGTGIQVGGRAPGGGWLVVSPLAESAAEHAGILPGERLLEISAPLEDQAVFIA